MNNNTNNSQDTQAAKVLKPGEQARLLLRR